MLLFVLLLLWVGCTKEEEKEIYNNYSLYGKWHLISYGGGFTGQFSNYDREVITWTFDTINHKVYIKNKRNYFGPNAGIYPYELRRNDNDQILYFNDSVQGILYINESELLYSHVGLLATFKR
ncbi:hypothetical protein [Maribacter cobaltidurans]|nr:hypothetical protein [Maribacter cobaltidurans]